MRRATYPVLAALVLIGLSSFAAGAPAFGVAPGAERSDAAGHPALSASDVLSPQAPYWVQEGESEDEGEAPSGNMFRRFWPRWRSTNENERNHQSVREAFRDSVASSLASTVQVLSDNRRVALGTVIDTHGFIITKASELKDKIECRFVDGRKLPANLVTVNDELDVAVLHVDALDLVPVVWREGDAPLAGSWLASIGSSEIPSAVGVVSAEPRLIATPRPVLGVLLETAGGGARVTSVMPDSPAQQAGIEALDVIVEVNGKAIQDQESLVAYIRTLRPGDRVALIVLRGEKKLDFSARLAEINSLAQGRRVDFQNSLGGPLSNRRWGFPSVLQHDTILRPNDCGGPIVDLDGRAVGINIARAGRVESYALPVAALQPVLDDVRSGKYGPSGTLDEKAIAIRAHELRIAVQELTDRCDSLAKQIATKREVLAQDQDNKDAASEVASLEAAAASAREQLDQALAQLRRFDRTVEGEVSTTGGDSK